MCKKIAVIFPGMGYHSDKPLLYYGKKVLMSLGYEIHVMDYGEIPMGKENMEKAFQIAYKAVIPQLTELFPSSSDSCAAFNSCGGSNQQIVFLSKSIGTILALKTARDLSIPAAQLLTTPVDRTLPLLSKSDKTILFHGTSDPYMENEPLRAICKELSLPLYEFEGANHSIELHDDLVKTTEYIHEITKIYTEFLTSL